jgi:membrane protein YqaA with SNARE-associated domain
MLVIWRGIGGVAFIIAIIACLVTNIVTSKVFDENNYFQRHLWPKVLALGISGVCCYFLGRYVNSRPPRIVIDQRTGQEIEQKPIHDLMFIKLEYWGLIFVGIALVLLVFNLASVSSD